MFDYFTAELKCPNCGIVGAAYIKTGIRDDAQGIEIPVGFELDAVEVRDQDLQDSGYLPTGNARSDNRTGLLAPWKCPTCGHPNWALVTLDGTIVSAIEAIVLDRATLANAQFISQSCIVLVAQLSGLPLGRDFPDDRDPIAVLRELLR